VTALVHGSPVTLFHLAARSIEFLPRTIGFAGDEAGVVGTGAIERIRVLVLKADLTEGVEQLPALIFDEIDGLWRPGAHDGLSSIEA
jgi:hypothetical protein